MEANLCDPNQFTVFQYNLLEVQHIFLIDVRAILHRPWIIFCPAVQTSHLPHRWPLHHCNIILQGSATMRLRFDEILNDHFIALKIYRWACREKNCENRSYIFDNIMNFGGVLFITAQCTLVHLRGLAIACRLSVCPSVRLSVSNVGDLWSHRLEILETNCMGN